MPTPRCILATAVVDGRIYAMGGTRAEDNWVNLSAVEVYDPVTDTWTGKADMPVPVWGHGAGVVGGTIYVVGGVVGGDVARGLADVDVTGAVQAYDPATDTWTLLSADFMPTPRAQVCVSVVRGRIHVTGGTTWMPWPFALVSTMEAYMPRAATGVEALSWGLLKAMRR